MKYITVRNFDELPIKKEVDYLDLSRVRISRSYVLEHEDILNLIESIRQCEYLIISWKLISSMCELFDTSFLRARRLTTIEVTDMDDNLRLFTPDILIDHMKKTTKPKIWKPQRSSSKTPEIETEAEYNDKKIPPWEEYDADSERPETPKAWYYDDDHLNSLSSPPGFGFSYSGSMMHTIDLTQKTTHLPWRNFRVELTNLRRIYATGAPC